MAKKITQAQKIRNYREKNPTATIADIAKKLGVRYQAVYQVLKPNGKTPESKWKTAMLATSKKAVLEKLKELPLTSARKAEIARQVEVNRWQPPAMIPMPEPTTDNVNQPAHYKVGGIETIDFIEAKGLNYHLGNVVKYIARADSKGNREEDLLKARWYLNREIAKFTKEQA
jgi:hypothetical protein